MRTRCVERDRGVGEEAAEPLLDVLVLGLVALAVDELLEGVLVALVERGRDRGSRAPGR